MSDDARPLIDNPYRASHTPIIAGDVNVTDLMARAWDRGFAAGDERLRSDFQSAVSPDERPQTDADCQDDCTAHRTCVERRGEAGLIEALDDAMNDAADLLAAADREKPKEHR